MIIITVFLAGFLLGTLRKDKIWWELCESQQERGNYWFDKYMSVVHDDWEPISKDFKD